MKLADGGALVSMRIESPTGERIADVNFLVTAEDLANPDGWPRMFFEPAGEALVSQLKKRLQEQRDTA